MEIKVDKKRSPASKMYALTLIEKHKKNYLQSYKIIF